MFTEKNPKKYYKITLAFVFSLLVRLIPFKAPNLEPIMALNMPLAKRYGAMTAFCFAFFSIIVFDLITLRVGVWTLITGLVYGSIGVLSFYYFKDKDIKKIDYVKFSIFGTILFDCVTGLSIGPIFFNQPFMNALLGQVPFTAIHLAGNMAFAWFISPVFDQFLIKENKFEFSFLLKAFKLKNI